MNGEPTRTSPGGPRRPMWWLWVLLPLLALGGLEFIARKRLAPHWYDLATRRAPAGRPLYVFIGSSRVAAAVDADAFLSQLGQRDTHAALNLGQGESTLAEHFMGLRRLLRAAPNAFEGGGAVLVEAPLGLPRASTWDDPWMQDSSPHHLSSLVEAADLTRLWSSAHPLETKLRISSFVAFGASQAYVKRAIFWRGVVERGAKATGRLLTRVVDDRAGADTGAELDLRALGGIRTDASALERIRTMGRERAYSLPPRDIDWSVTVLASIADLVASHGGRTVAFWMPLSEPQGVHIRSAEGRDALARFQSHCGEWIDCASFAFATTDADFPDLWHLSKTRSAPYSKALAESYRSSTRGPE